LFFFYTLFSIQAQLFCGIIGSFSSPSRQPLAVFPAADSDNEMRGFAAFEAGFTLENASTSCLFNSYFPVGGTSTFNNGVLNLNLDLSFTSTANIANAGTINGNSYSLQLPHKNGTFTLHGMTINNTRVMCGSDISLNGTLQFGGNCVFDLQGKKIYCSSGSIVAAAGASLLIKDGIVQGVHNGTLLCADSLATLSLSNVTIIQDANYSFTQGNLVILDSVVMTGSSRFVYQSSNPCTIASYSEWYFDSGMTFSYAPSSNSRDLIVMQDRSSVLSFNTTTLAATTTGLRLTKGTLRVDGTCQIVSDATVAAQAISLGDGTDASNDIAVQLLAESGFYVTSGFVVYNNIN
jgi:hypothetical protein